MLSQHSLSDISRFLLCTFPLFRYLIFLHFRDEKERRRSRAIFFCHVRPLLSLWPEIPLVIRTVTQQESKSSHLVFHPPTLPRTSYPIKRPFPRPFWALHPDLEGRGLRHPPMLSVQCERHLEKGEWEIVIQQASPPNHLSVCHTKEERCPYTYTQTQSQVQVSWRLTWWAVTRDVEEDLLALNKLFDLCSAERGWVKKF